MIGDPEDDMERCAVCAKPAPDWPRGWFFAGDGRNYCPEHKGDKRFRAPSATDDGGR